MRATLVRFSDALSVSVSEGRMCLNGKQALPERVAVTSVRHLGTTLNFSLENFLVFLGSTLVM